MTNRKNRGKIKIEVTHLKSENAKALKAAFPHTIPIFAGFWFLGISYGILMNVSGFSFWYPFLMAIIIFGGSLEFIAASMLLGSFAPLEALMITLMIQLRHVFYGISMLDKFRGTGKFKPYLIYGMCDETFSINYAVDAPSGVDKGRFMFFVTLLNQLYWVSGALIGGIAGSFLNFNTNGLDFVMTAMFTVIFIEQWNKEKCKIPGIIGIAVTAVCLIVFGSSSFMLPSLAGILLLLTVLRKNIEGRCEI